MVDIHCHVLYGLDDGAKTLEDSVQMAEVAIADGITHVIATPHANSEYAFRPELIRERREELQARLQDRLRIFTGCDFHLSYENLQDIQANTAKYTLNQQNYLLVEFADFALPPALDQALGRLQEAGLKPIVTHPERNPLVRAAPERLRGWIASGCYVQITGMSLTGRFGRAAERAAQDILDRNWAHFVASDAHNVRGRPPRLRQAYDLVAARRGPEAARALFHDNPLAAWEGKPLPWVPEPEPADSPEGSRRRFFFF